MTRTLTEQQALALRVLPTEESETKQVDEPSVKHEQDKPQALNNKFPF